MPYVLKAIFKTLGDCSLRLIKTEVNFRFNIYISSIEVTISIYRYIISVNAKYFHFNKRRLCLMYDRLTGSLWRRRKRNNSNSSR